MKKKEFLLKDVFANADRSFFNAYGSFYESVNQFTGGWLSAVCNAMSAADDRLYRIETALPNGSVEIDYTSGIDFPGWDEPQILADGRVRRIELC